MGLLMELVCLRRREMVELLLHGTRAESIVEAMDVLLEYLRSLPAEEQAPIAVLLMCLDALVEPNRNITYKEEAIKTIARSLRCCLSEDTAVPSTRRTLLLLLRRPSRRGLDAGTCRLRRPLTGHHYHS